VTIHFGLHKKDIQTIKISVLSSPNIFFPGSTDKMGMAIKQEKIKPKTKSNLINTINVKQATKQNSIGHVKKLHKSRWFPAV